ncbi:MAG: hypothetical protein J6A16_12280, partial [Oscillospiraceae bacterium]|nr:hypothetical protein [Oscillospiraceae bacterium]
GSPVGVPCYVPDASQGEDNVHDYLGMNGFPILPTPDFENDAPVMLLTASSAYDTDIIDKLEKYVAEGGKAVVTAGFVKATLGKGIERITSVRYRDRRMSTDSFCAENSFFHDRWERECSQKKLTVPVMEFRNNSTWGAICKAICEEDACTLLARDTYGKGQMYTMVLPDAFSDIKHLPQTVLSRMRRELCFNGVRLEAKGQISIFHYDNDAFVIYPYVDNDTYDSDITVCIKDAKYITSLSDSRRIEPLYTHNGEAYFKLRAQAGKFSAYSIARN